MGEVDLYIRNQDRYHGITQFLSIAIEYWEEWADKNEAGSVNGGERAREGREYLDSIKDQRPREPGPYEMTVDEGIVQFAKDSAQGVDFMVWEIRELPSAQRGDVKRAQDTLSRLG